MVLTVNQPQLTTTATTRIKIAIVTTHFYPIVSILLLPIPQVRCLKQAIPRTPPVAPTLVLPTLVLTLAISPTEVTTTLKRVMDTRPMLLIQDPLLLLARGMGGALPHSSAPPSPRHLTTVELLH